jgi:hypothetical protein
MNVNISAIAIQVLKENRSIYIQYPGNLKNQAAAYYQYGEEIGVGLGGPDLMVTRKRN